MCVTYLIFFFSSRRRHTRCALVTGVQTCALPIYLKLTESEDPLAAGLEIMASPPGKRLQVMSLLSGGEQALTALALLFGVFLTNPAPICVMRSEEHTSELQSLMRNSYAVFCKTKKKPLETVLYRVHNIKLGTII